MTIPLYSHEQEFQGYIPERYALKLECSGVAKLVRHKKGPINRAVLRRRPGDPKPPKLRDHMGQAYSYRHELDDGHRPWALRPLGHRTRHDQSHEYNLAPQSTRSRSRRSSSAPLTAMLIMRRLTSLSIPRRREPTFRLLYIGVQKTSLLPVTYR